MSTRTQLVILKDNKPILSFYHHFDGYPYFPMKNNPEKKGGMLEELDDILKGLDSYNIEILKKSFNDYDEYEEENFICNHGDLEWIYHLDVSNDEKNIVLRYREIKCNKDDCNDINYNSDNYKWFKGNKYKC